MGSAPAIYAALYAAQWRAYTALTRLPPYVFIAFHKEKRAEPRKNFIG